MGDAGFPLHIWCPVSFSFVLLGREKDTEFGSISSWQEALEEPRCKVGGQGGLRAGQEMEEWNLTVQARQVGVRKSWLGVGSG